mgnify:CR=1 FL=1
MELKLLSTKGTPNGSTVLIYEIGNYTIWERITKYYTSISIHPNLKANDFLPVIFADDENNDGVVTDFKIETTAYGSLKIEDSKRFIEAYQEAVEVVEILKNKFISKDR